MYIIFFSLLKVKERNLLSRLTQSALNRCFQAPFIILQTKFKEEIKMRQNELERSQNRNFHGTIKVTKKKSWNLFRFLFLFNFSWGSFFPFVKTFLLFLFLIRMFFYFFRAEFQQQNVGNETILKTEHNELFHRFHIIFHFFFSFSYLVFFFKKKIFSSF